MNNVNITLVLTERCNKNCKFCFEKNKVIHDDMTLDVAKRSIDKLIGSFDNVEELNINFFGGEPTIKIPTMIQIVEYVAEKYSHLDCNFGITTNGLISLEEVIKVIYEHFCKPMNILTSVHDLGVDSMCAVMNIQRYIDLYGEWGFDHKEHLSIKTVVTNETLDEVPFVLDYLHHSFGEDIGVFMQPDRIAGIDDLETYSKIVYDYSTEYKFLSPSFTEYTVNAICEPFFCSVHHKDSRKFNVSTLGDFYRCHVEATNTDKNDNCIGNHKGLNWPKILLLHYRYMKNRFESYCGEKCEDCKSYCYICQGTEGLKNKEKYWVMDKKHCESSKEITRRIRDLRGDIEEVGEGDYKYRIK